MSKPEPNDRGTEPAAVFAALGDATRLRLVSRLSDGRPLSIAKLSDGARVTRQAVAKHLRVLEEAGVVASRRVGRERRFVLVPEPLAEASGYLDRVSRQWDDALDRLRAFVEDD